MRNEEIDQPDCRPIGSFKENNAVGAYPIAPATDGANDVRGRESIARLRPGEEEKMRATLERYRQIDNKVVAEMQEKERAAFGFSFSDEPDEPAETIGFAVNQ